MQDRFEKLIQEIENMRRVRDWNKFHSLKNLAISLNLEASEILEKFQWGSKETLSQKETEEIHDEIADVFINLIFLAQELDIDLIEKTQEKIIKIDKKYPVEKIKGLSKKDLYEAGKIKKEVLL